MPAMDLLVMARSTSKKPSLSTLPVELLDKIFQLVDDPDLVSLRFVSKSVCAIASRSFAARNFTSCRHVVSKHSFETLLAISAHSVFGAYIKKIMVIPSRAILDFSLADDFFVESGAFSKLMLRILSNIRKHSGSITIGILEYYGENTSTYRQRFLGKKASLAAAWGIASRPSEMLELVLAQMRAAEVDVNGLHLTLELIRKFDDAANRRTYKMVAKFLKSRDSPIDLRFVWEKDKGLLEYDHLRSRLYFSAPSLTLDRAHPDVKFIEGTVRWLSDKSLSDVHLQDLVFECLPFLNVYLPQPVQTITLSNIKVQSSHFAQGLYSDLFQRLSMFPNLKHCKFHRIHYKLSFPDPDGENEMQLMSGMYQSNWSSLLLIFPDGKREFEVRGADVPKQLENLAAYTAAAERRKVKEIETRGILVDYRVMGADTPIFPDEDADYPRAFRLPFIIR